MSVYIDKEARERDGNSSDESSASSGDDSMSDVIPFQTSQEASPSPSRKGELDCLIHRKKKTLSKKRKTWPPPQTESGRGILKNLAVIRVTFFFPSYGRQTST